MNTPRTLIDLLRQWATEKPAVCAFAFLQDGETIQNRLTYAELHNRAIEVASQLQHCTPPGQRALLLFPPGLAFIIAFFACLYAGVIAVPSYPPRRNRPDLRLRSIAADAEPSIVLTTAEMLECRDNLVQQTPALEHLHWCATDRINNGIIEWQAPTISRQDIAFLQYTSGSTGVPKGVIVTHGNLMHNAAMVIQAYQVTAASSVVSWLPPYHDMGLVGNIIQPIYSGISSFLMPPMTFLQQPIRWLQAISEHRATVSGGPDFAYALCTQKITQPQLDKLDLSCWEVAFTGAEPIRAESLEKFSRTFAPCGFRKQAFYPCYGMAEATLFITGGKKTAEPVIDESTPVLAQTTPVRRVGCGHTWQDQEICIVDPWTQKLCAASEIGEIWLTGQSVCQGYWRKPKETADTFQADVKGSGPYLRTGDLGYVKDGELFVSGRLKDLIIIRGQNHYPQDIEYTVGECHKALRPACAVAFSVEREASQLVIVAEIDRHTKIPKHAEIAHAIRHAVAQTHALVIYTVLLVRFGQIPKTPSGKIQRFACRDRFMHNGFQSVLSDVLENHLSERPNLSREALLAVPLKQRQEMLIDYLNRWGAHLMGIPYDDASCLEPLSIDSLTAVGLQSRIDAELGISISLAHFFHENIQTLVKHILIKIDHTLSDDPDRKPMLKSIPRADVEALSIAQKRFWFLHQLEPDNTNYNMPAAWALTGRLDAEALAQSLAMVVQRHETLRTAFLLQKGLPVQKVEPNMTVPLTQIDLEALPITERLLAAKRYATEEAQKPFQLSDGPLLRVTLLQLAPESFVLLIIAHHIIFDGWSEGVFMQSLAKGYRAIARKERPAFTPLRVQYIDYAHWQTQCLDEAHVQASLDYWTGQLADCPDYLALPTDYPRSDSRDRQGAYHDFSIPDSLHQKLIQFNHQNHLTLYMTMLTAFACLLFRYSDQRDMVLGSPIANRTHPDIEPLIGIFANTVAVRIRFQQDSTFQQLLSEVRKTTLDAYEHADLPFDKLVETLQPERDVNHSPFFNVMFARQNAATQDWSFPGLMIKPFDFDVAITHHDLSLHVYTSGQQHKGVFLYRRALFNHTTIARMSGHYLVLLEAAVTTPQTKVSQLPLLTEAESMQLMRMTDPNAHVANLSDEEVDHILAEML